MKKYLVILIVLLLVGCEYTSEGTNVGKNSGVITIGASEKDAPADVNGIHFYVVEQNIKTKCYPDVKRDVKQSFDEFGYLTKKIARKVISKCVEQGVIEKNAELLRLVKE